MANFLIPFGRDSEKRLPSLDERQNGFPCGPADQRLFNGLFNRIESEIGEVIDFAGLTGDDNDLTQLRQAIEAMIAAATGGGDTSQFLLVSQARARLPIWPEIVSADNKMNVSSPASGTIRIPGGVDFWHRGIYKITTVQTDFASTASKTYHVRWNAATGYVMKDLADVGYNPTAAAESDARFDSTYDDMLMARVVTNSSNVPTITNLANGVRLKTLIQRNPSNADAGASGKVVAYTVDFARTPIASLQSTTPPGGGRDSDLRISVSGLSRYGLTVTSWNWTADANGDAGNHNSPGYVYDVVAF